MIVFCAFALTARAHAQFEPVPGDGTGNAAFLGLGLTTQLAPQTKAFALAAHRTGEVDFTIAQTGVRYDVNANLSMAVSYFGLFQGPTESRPSPRDHRVRLDPEIRTTIGNITIQHRARFEYRFRDLPDGWRYRPELRLSRPFRLGGKAATAFVAVEPFYELNSNEFTLVLTQAGARIKLSDIVSIQPNYLRTTAWSAKDLNFYSLFVFLNF